jgi:hypothetical protein
LGDEVSSRKWEDDLRGGGLGGGAGKVLVFFLMVASRTVEFDDEEVRDSLTAARPCGSMGIASTSFPVVLRVTGGLLRTGL